MKSALGAEGCKSLNRLEYYAEKRQSKLEKLAKDDQKRFSFKPVTLEGMKRQALRSKERIASARGHLD